MALATREENLYNNYFLMFNNTNGSWVAARSKQSGVVNNWTQQSGSSHVHAFDVLLSLYQCSNKKFDQHFFMQYQFSVAISKQWLFRKFLESRHSSVTVHTVPVAVSSKSALVVQKHLYVNKEEEEEG